MDPTGSGSGGYPPLVNQPPSLLPNLSSPIMAQQMYQRMGRQLPGGMNPAGVNNPMLMGTGGPSQMYNPNSSANIAAALSQGPPQ